MKISIIGASGKVGMELIRLLAEQNEFNQKINVVLYAPNNARKIAGNLEDIDESLRIRGKPPFHNIFFLATSDINSIKKSNLVIVCSGLFATREEKQKIAIKDRAGRDIQSIKNYLLISDICKEIKNNAPNANVLIVTNQSDVMSARAREIIQHKNIYGLGCYLDTVRFKNILVKEALNYGCYWDFSKINATLLGFHNENVFIDENNFYIPSEIDNIEKLLKTSIEKTIARGKEISDMQKDVHLPDVNSGSSKLPAAAIYNIINAFTQPQKQLTIPLNRLLTAEELSDIGEKYPVAAQLYCSIEQNSIRAITTKLSPKNIDNLKEGIKTISLEIVNVEKNHRVLKSELER